MTRQTQFTILGAALVVIFLAGALVLGLRQQQPAAPTGKPKLKPIVNKSTLNRPNRRQIINKAGANRNQNWGTPSTEESRKDLNKLLDDIESGDEDRITKAIVKSIHLATPELVKFTQAGLKSVKDPNYRRDLVNNLTHISSKRILPALAQAAQDTDSGVRTEAIGVLANFDASREEALEKWESGLTAEEEAAMDAQQEKLDKLFEVFDTEDVNLITKLLQDALNDEDPEVRSEALSTIKVLGAELQLAGLQAAISSPYEDVVMSALRQMSGEYNKDTLLLTLEALNNPSEKVWETAQDHLERMLSQTFQTREEAISWWNKNADKYDYDLSEIPTDTP